MRARRNAVRRTKLVGRLHRDLGSIDRDESVAAPKALRPGRTRDIGCGFLDQVTNEPRLQFAAGIAESRSRWRQRARQLNALRGRRRPKVVKQTLGSDAFVGTYEFDEKGNQDVGREDAVARKVAASNGNIILVRSGNQFRKNVIRIIALGMEVAKDIAIVVPVMIVSRMFFRSRPPAHCACWRSYYFNRPYDNQWL